MDSPPQLQQLNVGETHIAERILHPLLSPTRLQDLIVHSETLRSNYSMISNVEESFHSTNENGQTCRICRFVNSTIDLIPCPCSCTGSVGFVHMACLQRWIRFRRDNSCEICRQIFDVPPKNRDYSSMAFALFKPKYIGPIIKNILSMVVVTPLVYFTMNQLIFAMDNINENPNTFKLILVGPSMLLGTSIYFFLYFDWALSRLFRIRNILVHWWHFGDQDDDEYDPSYDVDSVTRFFEID